MRLPDLAGTPFLQQHDVAAIVHTPLIDAYVGAAQVRSDVPGDLIPEHSRSDLLYLEATIVPRRDSVPETRACLYSTRTFGECTWPEKVLSSLLWPSGQSDSRLRVYKAFQPFQAAGVEPLQRQLG